MREDNSGGDGSGRDRRPGQNPGSADSAKKLIYKRVRVADLLNDAAGAGSGSTSGSARPSAAPNTSGASGSSSRAPVPPPPTHHQPHDGHAQPGTQHQNQHHQHHQPQPHGTSYGHRGLPVPSLTSTASPTAGLHHVPSSAGESTHGDRRSGLPTSHRGSSALPCPECKGRFQTKELLKEHRRTEHPRSDLMCPHCHSSFFDRGNLNKHVGTLQHGL
jgi:hypothetical protein